MIFCRRRCRPRKYYPVNYAWSEESKSKLTCLMLILDAILNEAFGKVQGNVREVKYGPGVGQELVQVAADQSRPLCKGQVFLELTKSALK